MAAPNPHLHRPETLLFYRFLPRAVNLISTTYTTSPYQRPYKKRKK
jgi:hypothetical protein